MRELTWVELVVLVAASIEYPPDQSYQRHCAIERTGVSGTEYDYARLSLMELGLLFSCGQLSSVGAGIAVPYLGDLYRVAERKPGEACTSYMTGNGYVCPRCGHVRRRHPHEDGKE